MLLFVNVKSLSTPVKKNYSEHKWTNHIWDTRSNGFLLIVFSITTILSIMRDAFSLDPGWRDALYDCALPFPSCRFIVLGRVDLDGPKVAESQGTKFMLMGKIIDRRLEEQITLPQFLVISA